MKEPTRNASRLTLLTIFQSTATGIVAGSITMMALSTKEWSDSDDRLAIALLVAGMVALAHISVWWVRSVLGIRLKRGRSGASASYTLLILLFLVALVGTFIARAAAGGMPYDVKEVDGKYYTQAKGSLIKEIDQERYEREVINHEVMFANELGIAACVILLILTNLDAIASQIRRTHIADVYRGSQRRS